ncbi:ankyrin, partial [Glonium stellatum]
MLDNTAILLATTSSPPEVVQLLIDRGADLHLKAAGGWTPIHLAFDNAMTTRILMKSGADVNHIANNSTPLLLAVEDNQINVVGVLLSFGPNLEVNFSNEYTALGVAATRGYVDIVRLLLEAGANVYAVAERNSSPLQYAVCFDKEDIVRVL